MRLILFLLSFVIHADLSKNIDIHKEKYEKLALEIWSLAEMGYLETKSSKLLQDTLSGNNSEKDANTTIASESSIYIREKIESFFDNPLELEQQRIIKVPDGSPIGMDSMSCDFDY